MIAVQLLRYLEFLWLILQKQGSWPKLIVFTSIFIFEFIIFMMIRINNTCILVILFLFSCIFARVKLQTPMNWTNIVSNFCINIY